MVYHRQEKFEFAEHHFRTAFQINPRSSIIMTYLGQALHALKVTFPISILTLSLQEVCLFTNLFLITIIWNVFKSYDREVKKR